MSATKSFLRRPGAARSIAVSITLSKIRAALRMNASSTSDLINRCQLTKAVASTNRASGSSASKTACALENSSSFPSRRRSERPEVRKTAKRPRGLASGDGRSIAQIRRRSRGCCPGPSSRFAVPLACPYGAPTKSARPRGGQERPDAHRRTNRHSR